jgi:hypothetical protein
MAGRLAEVALSAAEGGAVGPAPLGVFSGLEFHPGSLTLVAGAPGAGKTSFLLGAAAAFAGAGLPTLYLSYEPTPEELAGRLRALAAALTAGPHGTPDPGAVRAWLADRAGLRVLYASVETDTLGLVEGELYRALRPGAPAFLAVDYLQVVPAFDVGGGLLPPHLRPGRAAVELKRLAQRNGWAVAAAAALRAPAAAASRPPDIFDLLGDERAAYEADRVLAVAPGPAAPCGCRKAALWVLKDRRGAVRTETRYFCGARYAFLEAPPPCLEGTP